MVVAEIGHGLSEAVEFEILEAFSVTCLDEAEEARNQNISYSSYIIIIGSDCDVPTVPGVDTEENFTKASRHQKRNISWFRGKTSYRKGNSISFCRHNSNQ